MTPLFTPIVLEDTPAQNIRTTLCYKIYLIFQPWRQQFKTTPIVQFLIKASKVFPIHPGLWWFFGICWKVHITLLSGPPSAAKAAPNNLTLCQKLFAGSCQTTINFWSSSISVTISSSFPRPHHHQLPVSSLRLIFSDLRVLLSAEKNPGPLYISLPLRLHQL